MYITEKLSCQELFMNGRISTSVLLTSSGISFYTFSLGIQEACSFVAA